MILYNILDTHSIGWTTNLEALCSEFLKYFLQNKNEYPKKYKIDVIRLDTADIEPEKLENTTKAMIHLENSSTTIAYLKKEDDKVILEKTDFEKQIDKTLSEPLKEPSIKKSIDTTKLTRNNFETKVLKPLKYDYTNLANFIKQNFKYDYKNVKKFIDRYHELFTSSKLESDIANSKIILDKLSQFDIKIEQLAEFIRNNGTELTTYQQITKNTNDITQYILATSVHDILKDDMLYIFLPKQELPKLKERKQKHTNIDLPIYMIEDTNYEYPEEPYFDYQTDKPEHFYSDWYQNKELALKFWHDFAQTHPTKYHSESVVRMFETNLLTSDNIQDRYNELVKLTNKFQVSSQKVVTTWIEVEPTNDEE